MTAVLYALPASHPCAAVERALQLKDVPYRRKDSIPVLHRLEQYARFHVATVPTITFDDGSELTGSTAIMRALDVRVPEPSTSPRTRSTGSASSARRSGATRCCSRSCAASCGRRCAVRRAT